MLVLLMLQLLTISTLAWCEQDVSQQPSVLSLLAIRNSEDSEGVEITIFTNSTIVFEECKSIHIPGRRLSSECGDYYFRCQDLLVEMFNLLLQDDRELEVIFVPLDNGILLLSRWCNSNSQTVAVCTWNTFLLN